MVLVLLGISFITFCLVMLAPGDPVRQMIAGNEDIVVSQIEIDALRHELGLDKPFIFQYLDWLGSKILGLTISSGGLLLPACPFRISGWDSCFFGFLL